MRAPSSAIVAGTSTSRTTVASIAMAVARPMPIILMATAGSSAKPRNTATMISAAEVMTRAVEDRPATTEPLLSPVRRYSSRTRLSRNTS